MARVDLDSVTELGEAVQRVIEAFRALERLDREVRPCRVADEERVAREDEPGLVCPRTVDDCERAVLRPVPRRVQGPYDDVAERDLISVLQRLVRERGASDLVDSYRNAVIEREAAVAGHVVGVRVRLEHARESHVASLALVQVLLDRIGRIDDGGHSGVLVAHEVRSAPEVVVDELLEEHGFDASNVCGYIS